MKTAELALNRRVLLHLSTGLKSPFDIINNGNRMSEKRLMLDTYAAKEGYKANDISIIGFCALAA